MMRASSVAEATARAVVAAVGRLRREPLTKPPGIAEAVDWAEAATLLHERGAPLAGRLQALDRRRAQGRGGSRLHLRPARRHASRRWPHERRTATAARGPRRSSPSPRCCAPTALPSRRSRRRRSWPPSSCWARAASTTSAAPGTRRSAPPPERREEFDALFDIHFLGAEAHRPGRRATMRTSFACRRTARRGRAAAADDVNEVRAGRDARRGAGRAPLRRSATRRRAARFAARRLRACRGGAAIGACAPAAGRGPTCAAPCAKRPQRRRGAAARRA